jgi:hypothetical protein
MFASPTEEPRVGKQLVFHYLETAIALVLTSETRNTQNNLEREGPGIAAIEAMIQQRSRGVT